MCAIHRNELLSIHGPILWLWHLFTSATSYPQTRRNGSIINPLFATSCMNTKFNLPCYPLWHHKGTFPLMCLFFLFFPKKQGKQNKWRMDFSIPGLKAVDMCYWKHMRNWSLSILFKILPGNLKCKSVKNWTTMTGWRRHPSFWLDFFCLFVCESRLCHGRLCTRLVGDLVWIWKSEWGFNILSNATAVKGGTRQPLVGHGGDKLTLTALIKNAPCTTQRALGRVVTTNQ